MPSYLENLFGLQGKWAVVTGGTRGIGQAMALAMAEAGADIVLVQRDTTNRTTHDKILSLGRQSHIVTCDLTSEPAVSSLVSQILTLIPRISILLNCAGIQDRHPAHEFPTSAWDTVLHVNLTVPFILCRDVGAHMLSQSPDAHGSRGKIINVGSLLSFQGGITVPAYAASKGGVAQLTKALSNEWAGKGVGVNAIAPGYIGTDMNEALIKNETRAKQILDRIPAGRWGSPGDFEGVAVWLASGASGYVSGEVVTIDGGWMGR
ncbi:short-chain dehydrogenase-like protein 5 [Elsinoe australis]|uniref:Short-chain dehydrogenase-like protein 5 n=1 Tax=Elsinoe australis TaxID=40998 RepID=A0A4U7B6T3_9PEZI|nr:short-chain dehydrogenase-like protein 5 [Elsinoe australis]